MVCMTQHSSGGTPKTARTVGVEEELLLVDSESGLARSVAHQVLRVAERRGDTQSDNGKPGGSLGPELQEQRSEEHTSELQSLMRSSYAVFCLKKKNSQIHTYHTHTNRL